MKESVLEINGVRDPQTRHIPVRELTPEQAKAELKFVRELKSYGTRYFELDQRVQNAAVAEWVHEDVFGPYK
jgi:hypothetical protein